MAEQAHPNIGLVGRMYECFGKGDMDTIKKDIFAEDIKWSLPGHHPLSGTKVGADEVIAFFVQLGKTYVHVDNVSFGTIGENKVVENHSGHGHINNRDFLFPTCSVYTIENGKIANVQVYTADQHGVDDYFWSAYKLKTIPERLAE